MIKKLHLLILLLVMLCCQFSMATASDISVLDSMAARNIFYTNQSQECVISLSEKVLATAVKDNNTKLQFTTDQAIINALCISGRVNEAIYRAEQMHTKAYNTNDTLGLALTLESLGTIYLYVGLDQQAADVLNKIAPYIEVKYDAYANIMLQILQIQTYLNLGMNSQAFVHVSEAERILQLNNLRNSHIYGFYISCYKTIFNINTNKPEAAERELKKVIDFPNPDDALSRWKDYVLCEFYSSKEDYNKAVEYCSLKDIGAYHSYYRIRVINRLAELYEASSDNKKAGELYQSAKLLADSLTSSQDITPLDSLLTQYHTNVAIARNKELHDQFMISVIKYGVLVCLVLIVMGLVLWFQTSKKNRIALRTKLARKKEIESVRTQDKLISSMSNELRTPLNAICGFSSVLSDLNDKDQDEAQVSLNYISHNSHLFIELLDRMNEYELLRKGEVSLSIVPCDIVSLGRKLVDQLKNSEKIAQNHIAVIFESSNEEITIPTDIHYLTVLIENLLSNAAKFTTEGHITLRINTNTQSDATSIIVEDTGIGIPANRHRHVFGALYKLNENTVGIGIGLTICQSIVTLMGGQIGFNGNYTNGTQVIVTIPTTSHVKKQPE